MQTSHLITVCSVVILLTCLLARTWSTPNPPILENACVPFVEEFKTFKGVFSEEVVYHRYPYSVETSSCPTQPFSVARQLTENRRAELREGGHAYGWDDQMNAFDFGVRPDQGLALDAEVGPVFDAENPDQYLLYITVIGEAGPTLSDPQVCHGPVATDVAARVRFDPEKVTTFGHLDTARMMTTVEAHRATRDCAAPQIEVGHRYATLFRLTTRPDWTGSLGMVTLSYLDHLGERRAQVVNLDAAHVRRTFSETSQHFQAAHLLWLSQECYDYYSSRPDRECVQANELAGQPNDSKVWLDVLEQHRRRRGL